MIDVVCPNNYGADNRDGISAVSSRTNFSHIKVSATQERRLTVEKVLRAKNLEMAKTLVRNLRSRGEFVTQDDAVRKLSDRDWLAAKGYLHVSDVIMSAIGQEAINEVFEEQSQ